MLVTKQSLSDERVFLHTGKRKSFTRQEVLQTNLNQTGDTILPAAECLLHFNDICVTTAEGLSEDTYAYS